MNDNNIEYEQITTPDDFHLEEARSFMECNLQALHICSAQGIIVWANQRELDLLGYDRDEYIGRHINEFHTDLFSVNDLLCRLIYEQEVTNYPVELKRKDGATVSALLNANIYVRNGKFIHTRCATTDVSELKSVQTRMQYSNARILNQLISSNSLLDLVSNTTWHTNFEGKITQMQAKWWQYTGQEFEQQRDFGWINVFHREERDKIMQNLQTAIRENREFRQLTRVFNKLQNTYISCGLYGAPHLGINNQNSEWVFILIDQSKVIRSEY